jgi:ubiquinone/menaquinone biosynthesis C-methylase UbiE
MAINRDDFFLRLKNKLKIIKSKLFLAIHNLNKKKKQPNQFIENPKKQELEMYWDEEFAKVLDTWGENNVWLEIQLLLTNCHGKVLDIACGTGKTIEILEKFKNIDVYGFDISEYLIEKAEKRGIKKENLKVYDAAKTEYPDNFFDYSYSIGSLEHFTKEGIETFLKECSRYSKIGSFHMIPVSRSGNDEGWLEKEQIQSFFNNSEDWWLNYFSSHFSKVYAINSKWESDISIGKWFLCYK